MAGKWGAPHPASVGRYRSPPALRPRGIGPANAIARPYASGHALAAACASLTASRTTPRASMSDDPGERVDARSRWLDPQGRCQGLGWGMGDKPFTRPVASETDVDPSAAAAGCKQCQECLFTTFSPRITSLH